ncbi:MAG: anthranilate synthase component II [Bacillota bacterium]
MILIIDNYDSFTYNLLQYFQILGEEVEVVRNDKIRLEDIDSMKPEIIVISPGPCTPNEAGVSLDVVKRYKGVIPILGICLGHQVIGQAFGAKVTRGQQPVHGKVHPVTHNNAGVFTDLKNPLSVTRYHSLVLDKDTLPECFSITAETAEGEIMGIMHKDYAIEGVQFHPEAILTEEGLKMLKSFIDRTRK